MEFAGIARSEFPIRRGQPDSSKICQTSLGGHLCENGITKQFEIRPNGGAKEGHIANLNQVIFQNVNICTLGGRFDLIYKLRDFLSVKFMVA